MCCDPVLHSADAPFEPPEDGPRRHVDLDPVPASVSVARAFVRDALADAEADAQDTALLLTSELVTNAILHARTPVQLGITVDDGTALVCVADRAASGDELVPQEKSRSRSGGRGLALVAEMSQRWGTTWFSGGKVVWFVLPVAWSAARVG